MGDEWDKPRKQAEPKIPPKPIQCSTFRCEGKATVLLCAVYNDLGSRYVGCWSDFAKKGKLPDMWKFGEWIARCAACFTRQQATAQGDWREAALRDEQQRRGLTEARAGELLSEYQRRHGMDPKTLGGVQRIPGSDDDLEEQHKRELARRMVDATEKTA